VGSAALFTGFSIGTALAPNLASFFVFRILTAFQGTAFLIIGSAVIGDIYKPVSSNHLIAKVSILCGMFLSEAGNSSKCHIKAIRYSGSTTTRHAS
jgi:MFS family permease